ncbi:MAG: ribonuclease P protein component [Cyanobacteria bacterium K_Offshore_0m_m2_072]|nr:ribonuclease P protein component [Cyanobacteria bacterium K_Offshore_0m_m2_072]
MALPQAHRLRGQRVFDALYRRGRAIHGMAMVLRWMPADAALLPQPQDPQPPSPWRCGVVVSSKVHKRAVQRNRLRRLLHQGLQTLMQAPDSPHNPAGISGLPHGIWLLISLKPGSATWEHERLLGECRDLLAKAGLTP